MSYVITMEWAGATKEQYEQLRSMIGWEVEQAPGGLFHVAAFDETGAHITDVWESPAQFEAFVESRLMPAVAQVGIEGQPVVEVREAHAIFAPGYQTIDLTQPAAVTT